MLEGVLDVGDEGALTRVLPGQAVLFDISYLPKTRWNDVVYLDITWNVAPELLPQSPKLLRAPNMKQVSSVVEGLGTRSADQRRTLASAFELFRSLGAPLELDVDALDGEPSERDRKLAGAMEHQMAHLASRATTIELGDVMKLSERQVHRIVEDFNLRYGFNAGNWRDTRNRWRVQLAVSLLSLRETTVAAVAKEVGYASPNALARAFAKAGLPPPGLVREHLLRARADAR